MRLTTDAAKRLYETAKTCPIIDYHCHLSPQEIYEDRLFEDIAQLWLAGDHYKWRLMRAFGVNERYITGDAAPYEKFLQYARCIGLAAGNPLYVWTQMELSAYFGIDEPLCEGNAKEIWERCNAVIRERALSPRKLIAQSNVRYIATTDDPADPLCWHDKIAADPSFDVRVAPAFRTDNLLQITKPGYPGYIVKLSKISGVAVHDLESLLTAVSARLDDFAAHGCRFSDCGIEAFPHLPDGLDDWVQIEARAADAFAYALQGAPVSREDYGIFLYAMDVMLAEEYKKRGMCMQLHIAVKRNANTRLFEQCGPDCGGDCVGDVISQRDLLALLDRIERNFGMPRTILYTLNPAMYEALATAAGSFPGVHLGAAWWFNDHEAGIRKQLCTYAQALHLAAFPGMLTDSRSFLSYVRHDYFRRILCDLVGGWIEDGSFADGGNAHALIRRICYENSLELIGGSL